MEETENIKWCVFKVPQYIIVQNPVCQGIRGEIVYHKMFNSHQSIVLHPLHNIECNAPVEMDWPQAYCECSVQFWTDYNLQ